MFTATKMYAPYSGGYIVEKVLGVLGLFFFALGIVFWCPVIRDSDLSSLFFVASIAAWCYLFM